MAYSFYQALFFSKPRHKVQVYSLKLRVCNKVEKCVLTNKYVPIRSIKFFYCKFINVFGVLIKKNSHVQKNILSKYRFYRNCLTHIDNTDTIIIV